jgi:nucleolin
MAAKSDKDKKPTGRKPSAADKGQADKPDPKPKKDLDDDDDDFDDDDDTKPAAKKAAKSAPVKKSKDDDDDDEDDDFDEDEKDEWEKVEEEENWDPDFDEFDIPKSRGGSKSSTSKPGKKGADEDDDFKLDDDFKEFGLFNDTGFDDGEEDDF